MKILRLILATAVPFQFAGPAAAKTKLISIGTGALSAVYFPTGGAITTLVNREQKRLRFRMVAEPTEGSTYNIEGVLKGEFQFGIAQSDRQFQAFHGLSHWKKDGPQKKLRAVFALQHEALTLVARADKGITTIEDLRGKRVAVGPVAGGTQANVRDALRVNGIRWGDDFTPLEIGASQAVAELISGEIDAVFHTVGHPNHLILKAINNPGGARFIPIPFADRIANRRTYYAPTTIPVSLYRKIANKEDVPTFGVRATLVTSSKVSEEIVYELTKQIFENFEEFVELHPALSSLTRKSMLEGNSAPYHPGALRYYKEAGLLRRAN